MKKLLSLLAMLLPLAAFAFEREYFEIDGVYYEGRFDKTTNDAIAYVMYRPDYSPYNGSFTYKSVVEYNGKKYRVEGITTGNLNNVEEITIESGFDGYEHTVNLDFDPFLRKINMHMFSEWTSDGSFTVSTGNNPDCVYVYLRDYGYYTEVVIDKFEVYGPDGKQLTPFISNPWGYGNRRFYPDENGVIRLGAYFRDPDMEIYDKNNYLGIEPVNGKRWNYKMVYLQAEYEGKHCNILTKPLDGQTDITATVDNVTYALDNNKAFIAEWTGSNDAVIPETIEVDGKQFPVTSIKADAFKNSDVTSIELPASITYIQTNAIDGCNSLTEITIKGTPVIEDRAIVNCESLECVRVTAPYEVSSGPFWNCPKLISGKILSFPSGDNKSRSDNDVVVSVKANLFDLDGNRLPLYVRTYFMDYYLPVENGVVSFDKSKFYDNYGGWIGYLFFNWLDYEEPLFYLYLNENYDGVESVETETTEVVRYFNLQGMPVASPRPGNIYIRCQGNKTSKVLIR